MQPKEAPMTHLANHATPMFGHPMADGAVCRVARSAQATKRTSIWAGGLSAAGGESLA